jgi:translation initiation factor IF-2
MLRPIKVLLLSLIHRDTQHLLNACTWCESNRYRGIVVAADDGVMPQTAEAIDHARAAGTPIIVAINKMDKESADVDRVLNELTQKKSCLKNGAVMFLCKSFSTSGAGIDELLDLILIQAELMELKASAEGAAQGVVIEARVDKGRGAVTSILVQNGTLNIGDLVLAGSSYGRVRAMSDENGQRIQSAVLQFQLKF